MPTATKPRSPNQSPAAKRTAASKRAVLKLRMRVTVDDVIAIGPGKVALLEAVDTTGSITAAAKALDMSYRRAWLLLDELNRSLAKPAIDSAKGGQRGGGSIVTAQGRKLILLYRRIEAHAAKSCQADIRVMLNMLAR